MSYRLDAVIGDFDHLRGWAEGAAVVAPLRQRMGLLLPSTALREDLPRTLRDLFRAGPVAQVEADFWGGDGRQTAALWRAGAREWGPVRTSDFDGPREDWPINAALARLGVASAGPGAPDYHDLFLEVGLGRGRDERDWSFAALEAHDVTTYDEWHARERARRESEERAAAERALCERLPGVPVPLNGKEIIALLGIPQGRMIGAAVRHLQQLHLDGGPVSRAEAEAALHAWAAEQGPAPASGEREDGLVLPRPPPADPGAFPRA
ncbi:hypothetical protein [Streptomyces oceani]|uniref:hypothetical protein n=1 Tax=Streptomyces oceani TaxID=1075402 RepID=UPI000A9FA29A|nr:hypothetical protein [Streptomyces oceani]